MFSVAYKWYVLGILTLVYTLNYLDRCLIILLLEPIKIDLHLSDTQLGFLTGIAFGLFYAILGLPIARWADRGNRTTITSIAIGLWGATVMLCVLVTNFAQLVLARTAAGIGESGCMPPTYSLLGDYFPKPSERTWAMVIYWLANPLAALLSFILGGWLSSLYGWRMTFFIMGLPGLLLAAVVKATVIEPRTRTTAARYAQPESHPQSQPLLQPRLQPTPPRLATVLTALWQQRSSRHLSVALILLFTMALGLAPWYGAFLIRSHGMSTAELGLWLGIIFGFSGVVGTLLGGYVSERWYHADERGQMRLSAIIIGSLLPLFALFLLLPGKAQSLFALVPLMMVFYYFLAPTFALLQRLVGDDIRATTLAVVMLVANLIGMGVGSQVVGMLSDLLAPRYGTDSLRYAMLLMSLMALWAAFHLWQVGRAVRDDLATMAHRPPPDYTGVSAAAFAE